MAADLASGYAGHDRRRRDLAQDIPGRRELGALLVHDFSEAQLQDALRHGFDMAITFDAGFGLSVEGRSLCLSQWLPGVRSWIEAAEPLEKLLNQAEMLRTSFDPVRDPMQDRIEQRMRRMWKEESNELMAHRRALAARDHRLHVAAGGRCCNGRGSGKLERHRIRH